MEKNKITLTISISNGSKLEVEADPDWTVSHWKSVIAEKAGVPAENQRLIYSGQVLKNENTLDSYHVKSGHTIHLVRGASRQQNSNNAATPRQQSSRSSPSPAAPQAQNQSQTRDSSGLGNMFGGMGGIPMGGGLDDNMMRQMQQQIASNPEFLTEMMNSPLMAGMFENPEMFREMMMSNPQFQEVVSRNPELGHVLNNPEVIRQSLEMMRNPSLVQEMMRSTDQALLNVESQPEGFNRLAQLYHDIEPLMDGAEGDGSTPRRNAQAPSSTFERPLSPSSRPFDMFSPEQSRPPTTGGSSSSSSSSSAAAGSQQRQSANDDASDDAPGGPGFGFPMFGGAGAGGLGGGSGTGGMPGGMDLESMATMMENPMFQRMTEQMTQNPEMLANMSSLIPGAANNPQLQEMLRNPEMLRRMVDPNYLRMMANLERFSSGMAAGGPGAGGATAGAAPGQTATSTDSAARVPQTNLADLMRLMQGQGQGPAQAQAQAQPQPSLEQLSTMYASQLSQLEDMGFTDRTRNIQLLRSANGNVNVVVERLLSQM